MFNSLNLMKWIGLLFVIYFGYTVVSSLSNSSKESNLSLPLHEIAQRLAKSRLDYLQEYKVDGRLADLGQKIFFDPRFSRSGQISCATCHQFDLWMSDRIPFSIPELKRNTPPVFNIDFIDWFFWDGRALSAVHQAVIPIESPAEHGISRWELASKVMEFYPTEVSELFKLGKSIPFDAEKRFEYAKHELLKYTTTLLKTPGNIQRIPLQLNFAFRQNFFSSLSHPDLLGRYIKLKSDEDKVELMKDIIWDFTGSYKWKSPLNINPDLPGEVLSDIEGILKIALGSIEEFQRKFIALDSPFDQFISTWREEREIPFTTFFGEKEFHGMKLFFGKAKCSTCHSGINFSDSQFHNIGLPFMLENSWIDPGRATGVNLLLEEKSNIETQMPWLLDGRESVLELNYLDANNPEIMGAFKTPSLRNIKYTAPYMHDGRFENISQVISHYNSPATIAVIGHREETLAGIELSEEEQSYLIAFLNSLNQEPIRL